MQKSERVSDIVPARPRVPLAQALAMVSEIYHRLEDGSTEPDAIAAVFSETRLDVAEAIDRRMAVKDSMEAEAEKCRIKAKSYAEAAGRLERAVEALKQNTLTVMQAIPDFPYADSAGRRIHIQQAAPRLVLDLGTAKKTFSNLVTTDIIAEHEIPLAFIQAGQFLAIDTAAVKAALEAGSAFHWAKLDRTTFLKGL